MDHGISQEEYIRHVLEAYRKTPGTMGTVRRADRMLAAQLYQRGLSVRVIENALVLGGGAPPDSARRCATDGHDSFAGLFPAGDRGSARSARQPGLLPTSPSKARNASRGRPALPCPHRTRLRHG